jgi:glyoxylase-like metal-dependent hydrolase (beta-lactamase superfamily II)
MNRIWLAAGFAALLALGFAITRGDAQPNTVKQIAPGVWFREGDLGQGHCNNVIIEMKDYLIVVDANFPSGARLALADAKKVSSKPVKFVFDTHHHGDHTYGNAVWTGTGATTIAYQGVAEEMKRYEPARWQMTVKERKDVAEMHRDAPEPPKQTFTDSPHVISDGTRRVEFYHFGWAHTRGDGFVYLPQERVLCSGDAAVNGPYNFTGDGNIGNWPKVLDGAMKLKVDHVLPGHGGPGRQRSADRPAGVHGGTAQGRAGGSGEGQEVGRSSKDQQRQEIRHASTARFGEEWGERRFSARSSQGCLQRGNHGQAGGGLAAPVGCFGVGWPYGGCFGFPAESRCGAAPFAGRGPGSAAG